MSGYYVFQAYDGVAAQELCQQLENIDLLVLNTEGTGTDTPRLVRDIRVLHPRLPVLHIGVVPIPGMPADVINVQETFTAERMLGVVHQLVHGEPPGTRDPNEPPSRAPSPDPSPSPRSRGAAGGTGWRR